MRSILSCTPGAPFGCRASTIPRAPDRVELRKQGRMGARQRPTRGGHVFRTPSTTDKAKDAVATGAEKVTDGAQVAADKAAELKVKAGEAASATAAGAATAKEKASDAAEVARDTAETVKEYAQEAAETLAPKVEHAKETFVDDVLPKVASALAAIAAGAAAARESASEAADRAPDAYAVLKGDAVAKRGGKGK